MSLVAELMQRIDDMSARIAKLEERQLVDDPTPDPGDVDVEFEVTYDSSASTWTIVCPEINVALQNYDLNPTTRTAVSVTLTFDNIGSDYQVQLVVQPNWRWYSTEDPAQIAATMGDAGLLSDTARLTNEYQIVDTITLKSDGTWALSLNPGINNDVMHAWMNDDEIRIPYFFYSNLAPILTPSLTLFQPRANAQTEGQLPPSNFYTLDVPVSTNSDVWLKHTSTVLPNTLELSLTRASTTNQMSDTKVAHIETDADGVIVDWENYLNQIAPSGGITDNALSVGPDTIRLVDGRIQRYLQGTKLTGTRVFDDNAGNTHTVVVDGGIITSWNVA